MYFPIGLYPVFLAGQNHHPAFLLLHTAPEESEPVQIHAGI